MIPEYRYRSLKKYSLNLFGMLFIAIGAVLSIEHIYFWGETTFFDFFGHEWLGLFLFLLGWGMNLKFWRKKK